MQGTEDFQQHRSGRLPQRRQEGRRATLDRCFLFSLGYKSSNGESFVIVHANSPVRAVGRIAGEHGSIPVGTAAAQNRGRLREKCETEKYQVRRTVRLRVNREAGKKVQRSSACETRSAILLQRGFTDSNRRKRIYKRKQQPSISPLPISRVRKQSHSEKVNCVPRSKTAFKAQSGRHSQDTLLSLLTKCILPSLCYIKPQNIN